MVPLVAIGQMATSRTGRVLMVALICHDLRRWEVMHIDDALGGVWHVSAWSKHRWLSSENGWTGSIKGNSRPVHTNLRIPATVSWGGPESADIAADNPGLRSGDSGRRHE